MNKVRSWMGGLGIGAPCVIFALAMTPWRDLTSSGAVHGRVTYNGRPLDGGYILFDPTEGDPGRWAIGPIGHDGYYAADSTWERESHKTQFRISVVPQHPERFTKVRTSGHYVTLGREPARVEVDLKD